MENLICIKREHYAGPCEQCLDLEFRVDDLVSIFYIFILAFNYSQLSIIQTFQGYKNVQFCLISINAFFSLPKTSLVHLTLFFSFFQSDVTSAGSLGTDMPSALKKPNQGNLRKLLIIFILMELWIMQNFNKLMKFCIIKMVTTVFP